MQRELFKSITSSADQMTRLATPHLGRRNHPLRAQWNSGFFLDQRPATCGGSGFLESRISQGLTGPSSFSFCHPKKAKELGLDRSSHSSAERCSDRRECCAGRPRTSTRSARRLRKSSATTRHGGGNSPIVSSATPRSESNQRARNTAPSIARSARNHIRSLCIRFSSNCIPCARPRCE
jgi:hypothetical protein